MAKRRKKAAAKKPAKRRTTRKKAAAPKRKKTAKRKPFGGITVCFVNHHKTMEDVFGSKPLAPSQMTKIIWRYIKKNKLMSR